MTHFSNFPQDVTINFIDSALTSFPVYLQSKAQTLSFY